MRLQVKIAVSMVFLLAVMWALDSAYTFGLRHNLNLKAAAVQALPHEAALLVHGPCEPLWMVSPAMLDSVAGLSSYNLALSHSDFADNYLHLYLYLKSNPPPSHMLLYVTPESMDARFNTFNSFRFAPYLGDSVVDAVVKENDAGYYRWHRIPFMRYAYYNTRVSFYVLQGYKHYFGKRKQAYYPDGFEPPARRVWGNHAGEFVRLYKDSVVFGWDRLREKYLQKVIRLAGSKGIRLMLYESPVLAEALAWQPNRKAVLSRLDSLAAAEGVPFVRFEGLDMARHRKYFISTLNMNMRGLRMFNDTLGRYLKGWCAADSLSDGSRER